MAISAILFFQNSTLDFVKNTISEIFIPYYPLSKRVEAIAKKNIASFREEDFIDLKIAFEVSKNRFFPVGQIKNNLSLLSEEQFKSLLQTLDETDDLISYYSAYLKRLDSFRLLKQAGFSDKQEAFNTYTSKYYSKSKALAGVIVKEAEVFSKMAIEIRSFIYHILEMLIVVTGFYEIKQDESSDNFNQLNLYQARSKLEFYLGLFVSPFVLYKYFNNYFEAKKSLLLTVTILILIPISIVSYLRYFKPCLKNSMRLNNLKAKIIRKNQPIYSRKKILREIEKAFQEKRGVIVVGESGSGKIFLVHSFVKELINNEICPFLKIQEVFENKAGHFKSGVTLSQIEEEFKHHEKEVVFFFEEMATFFKKDSEENEKVLGDSLQNFLDHFKYVIGTTTKEKFDLYMKDSELIEGRRFEIIRLPEIEIEEIEEILFQELDHSNPQIDLEEGIIPYIISKAPEFNPKTSLVSSSHALLKHALIKINILSLEALKNQIDVLKDSKHSLINKNRFNKMDTSKVLTKKLKNLSKEILEKQEELKFRDNQHQAIQKLEKMYLGLQQKSYRIAEKAKKSYSDEWLKTEALIKMMREFLQKKREEIGLFSCLNKKFIDSILDENFFQRIKINALSEKVQLTLDPYLKKQIKI